MKRITKFKICTFYDNTSVITQAVPQLFDDKDSALKYMDESEDTRIKYLRNVAEFVVMPVYKYEKVG